MLEKAHLSYLGATMDSLKPLAALTLATLVLGGTGCASGTPLDEGTGGAGSGGGTSNGPLGGYAHRRPVTVTGTDLYSVPLSPSWP